MQWARNRQRGFTIVELLIVVVVIAILAAITIVAYTGIQNRTHDATVQTDIANNGKLIMNSAAITGVYPVNAVTVGMKVSGGSYLTSRNNFYICINPTTKRFALSAISRSGKTYQNVDGTISQSASQLWGADTCDLIGSGNLNGAYDQSGGSGWQSWISAS
jgi:prepilin-type N-terminal cleavage/methylation domain-containing protein